MGLKRSETCEQRSKIFGAASRSSKLTQVCPEELIVGYEEYWNRKVG
jgi:hypothetical protein